MRGVSVTDESDTYSNGYLNRCDMTVWVDTYMPLLCILPQSALKVWDFDLGRGPWTMSRRREARNDGEKEREEGKQDRGLHFLLKI